MKVKLLAVLSTQLTVMVRQLGSMVCGMGALDIRHDGPAVGDGAPSIPVPADPPPEALF